MKIFVPAFLLILVLATSVIADPVDGTYYPAIAGWTTWQTYSNDGEGGNPNVYGDGLLAVGNVIMCWQSPLPSKLYYLCPNTLVGTVDQATDLVITDVSTDPPAIGTVVTYTGGQLELNGSLWGESGNIYMTDLYGGSATITALSLNDHTVTMDFEATGQLVSHPGIFVRFKATFVDIDVDTMSGFSGHPTEVRIDIGATVPTESASWGQMKAMNR